MEITVISRETIKPSSPTPLHLQHLKLSLIDQYMHPAWYGHVILFYSAWGDVHRFQRTNMSDRLKKSLSEVLTEFYPVAGKYNDNRSIHCNDQGLDYVEVRVKAPLTLAQFLNNPPAEELSRLLVYDPCKCDTHCDDKLSAVQVTVFDGCGGMAIGINLSHMVVDASSFFVFVNHWAAIARGDASRMQNNNTPSPKFGFASLFPPRDIPVRTTSNNNKDAGGPQPKPIAKRFFFHNMKIEALKANYAYQCPTRVEAVTALIFKCLINIAKSRFAKPIALNMPIDLRSRMRPPLPSHYLGNLAVPLMMEHSGPDSLNDVGVQLRKLIKEYDSDYVENLLADDALLLFELLDQHWKQFMNGEVRAFQLSSLCKLPLYVDFGWGVPLWAAVVFQNYPDIILLMDAKNGEGIEAWVTLDEDEMARFESEKLLREFFGHVPMNCMM